MKQLIIFYFGLSLIKSGTVCSEDELIRELREDLRDNGTIISKGTLDCLRNIVKPDQEDDQQEKLRKAAQWDSDCAFEAENADGSNSWIDDFKKIHKIDSLIDVDGKKLADNSQDNDGQADMCEIVRTLIGYGKFTGEKINIKQIPYDILYRINCVGGDSQTKVCAFNALSFNSRESWYIAQEPLLMRLTDEPVIAQQIFK